MDPKGRPFKEDKRQPLGVAKVSQNRMERDTRSYNATKTNIQKDGFKKSKYWHARGEP